MRLIKWLVILLSVYCFAIQSNAQPSSPIYYHWISRNIVYCWRSNEDAKPVVASSIKGGWSLSPSSAKSDPQWLNALKSKVSPNTPPQKIWDTFLKRLQEEPPNNEWAIIRYPDAQLYLRFQTLNSVLVTYIKEQKVETVAFVKDQQGWTPLGENSLRELSISVPEMKAIFGAEQAVSSNEMIRAAWSKWITTFLVNPSSTNPAMYLDSGNRPRWMWQERLIENDWNRRLSLPKPTEGQQPEISSSPAGSSGPSGSVKEEGKKPFYKELWFIVAILFLLSAVIFWKLIPLKPALSWTWRGLPLNLRHKDKSKVGRSDDLDNLYNDYTESAQKSVREFLEKVRVHIENERTSIIQEYGLDTKEPQDIKELISLGTEAENCYRALLQAQKSGAHSSAFTLYPRTRTKAEWLSELSASITSLELDIKDKEGGLEKLNAEKRITKAEKDQLQDDLEKARRELQLALQGAESVRNETKLLSAKLEGEQRNREDLEVVIDGIGSTITSTAIYMHQGLRYYLDQIDDPASAAVVSSLVNYSLFKLCTGIATQDDALRDAMLANLYSISSKLSSVNGFKLAIEEMKKSFSDIDSREKQLDRSEQSHPDEKLFSKLLRHMREYAQLELAPFYFAVDQDKKVHYAN